MKIRMFLVFGSAIAMVCLLMLALTAQRDGMVEASQAGAIENEVSSATAVRLTQAPHSSARLYHTSVLSFAPAFKTYLPIVARNYPPLFIWPIEGSPASPYLIGDAFGPRLNAGVYDWHRGVDIKGDKCDTVVVASSRGQVRISADFDSRYPNSGRIVQIQYPDKDTREYRTNYFHLCERRVDKDDYVEQGDVIGLVGDDSASWSHLHFEIRHGDTPQNPYCYLWYPDLDHHSIEISNVDTSNLPTSISVTLRVTTPRNELDINEVRVRVLALDVGEVERDNKYVNFNETHNCGPENDPDDNCEVGEDGKTQVCMDGSAQIRIAPQHFWWDIPTWEVHFTFSNLNVSSNSVKVVAEVKDCKGAVKQDSWSNQ